jgi:hypothetical protein
MPENLSLSFKMCYLDAYNVTIYADGEKNNRHIGSNEKTAIYQASVGSFRYFYTHAHVSKLEFYEE